MAILSISVSGVRELELALDKLGDSLDSTDILDRASAILLARTRKRYLEQTDPEGNKWIPSVAATLRARKGRGGGTLFDTGHLFHSIQLFAPDSNTREIGTDVEYGIYHQFGTKYLPKRQFLGISQDDTDIMVKFVNDRIAKALANV